MSILPSGRLATDLDTSKEYYSTQLATLLGELLESVMVGSGVLLFLLLAQHGQMLAYTGESLARLEASLAETSVESATTLENDP